MKDVLSDSRGLSEFNLPLDSDDSTAVDLVGTVVNAIKRLSVGDSEALSSGVNSDVVSEVELWSTAHTILGKMACKLRKFFTLQGKQRLEAKARNSVSQVLVTLQSDMLASAEEMGTSVEVRRVLSAVESLLEQVEMVGMEGSLAGPDVAVCKVSDRSSDDEETSGVPELPAMDPMQLMVAVVSTVMDHMEITSPDANLDRLEEPLAQRRRIRALTDTLVDQLQDLLLLHSHLPAVDGKSVSDSVLAKLPQTDKLARYRLVCLYLLICPKYWAKVSRHIPCCFLTVFLIVILKVAL